MFQISTVLNSKPETSLHLKKALLVTQKWSELETVCFELEMELLECKILPKWSKLVHLECKTALNLKQNIYLLKPEMLCMSVAFRHSHYIKRLISKRKVIVYCFFSQLEMLAAAQSLEIHPVVPLIFLKKEIR